MTLLMMMTKLCLLLLNNMKPRCNTNKRDTTECESATDDDEIMLAASQQYEVDFVE